VSVLLLFDEGEDVSKEKLANEMGATGGWIS
jgi:hypothetical protein